MTISPSRESATIYQFPVGGRRGVATRLDEPKLAVRPAPAAAPPTVSGSGWYHEAAVQDADRTRKN